MFSTPPAAIVEGALLGAAVVDGGRVMELAVGREELTDSSLVREEGVAASAAPVLERDEDVARSELAFDTAGSAV